ncbi:hypothetical protein BGX26_005405 [Mortierella sp. AD094]|nr:hypothetical protein BGX26_005405 [Mortierella sp. AD094]
MNRTSGLVTLHLEDLMLWECNEDVFSESAPFPHLKHLNIQKMRGIVPKDMLRLLKLCPNLKSLYWRGALTRAKFQVDQWVKDVESGVWSRLTCLDVQGEEFHDEGLSCVIKSLPLPLEKFMVKATGFGPMAFDALITTERHYNHIQELELSGCLDVESSMIQKIMAKMPALEYFSANRLFATDIVDTSGVDQNGDNDGQEWICKNLRTLKLCIDMGATSDPSTLEYKERQRQVYSRLSELELLETLEVGRDLVILGLKAEVRRLENGASAGLGQLLSLKRLKEVSINQGLTSLKLSRVTLTLDAVKALLAACANKGQVTRKEQKEDSRAPWSKPSGLVSLRLADLRFQSFDTTVFSTLAPLPHLEHIDVQRTHGIGARGFLRLLVLCPNIKSFYWRHILTGTNFRVNKWVKLVESGAWPRLTRLDVLGEEFKDEGLCRVIESLPLPLEKFMVRSTEFGPRSFNALISAERHCNHIQELELAGCLDVTSGMIQQIMTKMPALEYFSAYRLCVTDILNTSVTDRNDTDNSQDWVCTNLHTLRLCIDMGEASDPSSLEYQELQRQVYRQLSNLKMLEILNVGRGLPYLEYLEYLEVNASVRRLDSQPSAGLGHLLSLKRLKKFSSKPGESLTMRDIEQMMEQR